MVEEGALLYALDRACTALLRVSVEVMPPLVATAMTPLATPVNALPPEPTLSLAKAERKALISCGMGEEVGWEEAKGGGVETGVWVEVGMTESAGGCVGYTAKDLLGEGVALPVTFAAAEVVGWGSRVGAAVRVPVGVPEFFPGVAEVSAEAVEVGEAPGVVEGTFGALCSGRVDGVAAFDTVAALLVEALGFPVIWVEAEGKKGVTLGEGVLVCTLARDATG